jgi:hypothetical protein
MGGDGLAMPPRTLTLGAVGLGARAQARPLDRRQHAAGSGGLPADFRAGLEVIVKVHLTAFVEIALISILSRRLKRLVVKELSA